MNKIIKQSLETELEQLRIDMWELECGDDRLFTNANGNLPRYRAMQDRRSKIYELLEKGEEQ